MPSNQLKGTMSKPAIFFVDAHPDDSECFAGTAFLLRGEYDIHVVDLTHGENGLGLAGRLDGTTAVTRTAEEYAACGYLGATVHFLHDVNGSAEASRASVDALAHLLTTLRPIAIFTHWPVDEHPEHVQTAAVVGHALSISGVKAERYFFEASIGQTANWRPCYSVDVSATMPQKLEMLAKYACQNENGILIKENENRGRLRGRERSVPVEFAETFDTFDGKPVSRGVLERLAETLSLK